MLHQVILEMKKKAEKKTREAEEVLGSEDDLKDAVVDFLSKNPRPTDDEIHSLADKHKVEADDLEEIIYELLASLLRGVGKTKKTPDEKFNQKELKKGIEVEMEHTNDPYIAKLIAKDHLAELPDYYTRLVKMEKEAGLNESEEEKDDKNDPDKAISKGSLGGALKKAFKEHFGFSPSSVSVTEKSGEYKVVFKIPPAKGKKLYKEWFPARTESKTGMFSRIAKNVVYNADPVIVGIPLFPNSPGTKIEGTFKKKK